MLQCILITNRSGSVLLERFHGMVSAEECNQWRGLLVKLGQDNLTSGSNEEQFVACFRDSFVVYANVNDVQLYLLGKDEYDELGLSAILSLIVDVLRDVCKRTPTQSAILDRYGKICLALDEVMAQGILEHTDLDRIRRLMKLRPLEASK